MNPIWLLMPLVLIVLGVLLFRNARGFTEAFYARDEPNYYDETQPTFHEGRGVLDQRDREARVAIAQLVGAGSVIVGLGMLLIFVVDGAM